MSSCSELQLLCYAPAIILTTLSLVEGAEDEGALNLSLTPCPPQTILETKTTIDIHISIITTCICF